MTEYRAGEECASDKEESRSQSGEQAKETGSFGSVRVVNFVARLYPKEKKLKN